MRWQKWRDGEAAWRRHRNARLRRACCWRDDRADRAQQPWLLCRPSAASPSHIFVDARLPVRKAHDAGGPWRCCCGSCHPPRRTIRQASTPKHRPATKVEYALLYILISRVHIPQSFVRTRSLRSTTTKPAEKDSFSTTISGILPCSTGTQCSKKCLMYVNDPSRRQSSMFS